MSIPAGWQTTRLIEVTEKPLKMDPAATGRDHVQYVDIGALEGPEQLLRSASPVVAAKAPSRCRQVIRAGDTIYATVRPYLRKMAYIGRELDGEFASTGFCVLRPHAALDPKYLYHWCTAAVFEDQVLPLQKGVSYPAVLDKEVRAALIHFPSRTEQRRIVELVEEHLSHLDAADAALALASAKSRGAMRSALTTAIPDVSAWPDEWEHRMTKDAGNVQLGRQRHPDWHTGPNMKPYLRVANVFECRIDTSSVMEMHWPDDSFDRFRLEVGDVLLNEGQSPEFLGRPAIYRGIPEEVAFTNTILRFRANPEVNPEFALIVFRRHMHAGRFIQESRITTNIAHLSAARLKTTEFPVPPLDEQRAIVSRVQGQLDGIARLQSALNQQRAKSKALRRAVLAAAFSGRLTGHHSDADAIEELGEHVTL